MISATATGAQTDQNGNVYVLTDSQGNFSISAANSCPNPNSYMYFVSSGGDPGTGQNNPYLALAAVIPTPCGEGFNFFVDLSETTTSAAAYALGSFATVSTESFATSGNSVSALQGAVAYANSLINTANATIPSGSAWETTLNTAADILATCTESTGTTACTNLFTATTPPGGTAPTDTFQAALDIALNPNLDLTTLFDQISSASPFQPVLASLPTSWTLPGSTSKIIGVSPQSAPVNSTITIGGSGFGATRGSGVVIINGIQAYVISWSDTAIVALVPSGAATNGVIQECANLLCTNNIPFIIGPTIGPFITFLSLPEGPPLMGFVINGGNFGGVQGNNFVTLGSFPNQTSLTVLSWTASQITVQIPQNTLAGGNVVVTVVTPPGGFFQNSFQSNGVNFTLDTPFGCQ
jgi:hypothetical protein